MLAIVAPLVIDGTAQA